jgi:hypothetical protein
VAPESNVTWYWVTAVVVMACSAEIDSALSTVTVPVVETGLLDPPLILYPVILVPAPADLPYTPLMVSVTGVDESYQ